MPAIQPGSLVLVTGASGFIAAHAVEAFLDAGFPVRGTVRSDDKGEFLKNLFKDKKQKFEYVIVKDIGEDNAFDEAVKGVDAVAHMASPFHFNAEEPSELFIPAINGTVGVLKSIKKNNPDVKRVVITSSVAAVMDSTLKPPHTFTEKDWNTISPAACEKDGKNASGSDKYRASKTLAEQAFWKFIKDEKPSFDGVTINPPLVLGPIIHPCDKPESLNTSVAAFYEWQRGNKSEEDFPALGNFVDVRDCALAHVKALTVEEAGGERFIVGAGPHSAHDWVQVLSKLYPQKQYPKFDPSVRGKLPSLAPVHDGSKAEKVLGVKYTSIDKSSEDMAKDLETKFGL